MAIVTFQGPCILYYKCIYASKPEWWTEPNVWQQLHVIQEGYNPGTSDLFWEITEYPCPAEMTLEELELTVRAIYPQFPEGVYEIHRMGAA